LARVRQPTPLVHSLTQYRDHGILADSRAVFPPLRFPGRLVSFCSKYLPR
jgi:hypothetical protein